MFDLWGRSRFLFLVSASNCSHKFYCFCLKLWVNSWVSNFLKPNCQHEGCPFIQKRILTATMTYLLRCISASSSFQTNKVGACSFTLGHSPKGNVMFVFFIPHSALFAIFLFSVPWMCDIVSYVPFITLTLSSCLRYKVSSSFAEHSWATSSFKQ